MFSNRYMSISSDQSLKLGLNIVNLSFKMKNIQNVFICFGILGLVALTSGDDLPISPFVTEITGDSAALKEIREAIRQRFDLYISQVREVHGLDVDEDDGDSRNYLPGIKSRQRRAVIKADTVLPGRKRRNITEYQTIGIQVVKTVHPLNLQGFSQKKFIDLNTFTIKGQSYIFSLEVTDTGTYTIVYSIGKDLIPREIVRELTPGAIRIDVHQIDSAVYVLPTEYNETSLDPLDAGSNLYRFDLNKRKLFKQQIIDTTYACAVNFWTGTGEEANDDYLAVAPEFTIKSAKKSYKVEVTKKTYKVEVSLYRWQGAHFDYVYSLPAWNPQAIRYARILSSGFLAVANYQDDSGTTAIESEIFRYNHKESQYVPFQKIRTHGAKDMEFFSFVSTQQEEYFLAIANNGDIDRRGKRNLYTKSHIFKYGRGRFIPFQSFETYGALQFLSVKMESKSFLVLGESNGIRIFQYNGWKFTQTTSFEFTSEALIPNFIRLRPFIHGIQPFFIVASVDIQGGIYAVEFEQKNDYNEITSDFEVACKKALTRIESENMTQLLEEVNTAPKWRDSEILLQGSLEFMNNLEVKNLFTKKITYSGIVFDAENSKDLAAKERNLLIVDLEMKKLWDELAGVVLRNEDRTIHSEIKFRQINYSGPPLKVNNLIITNRLNGYLLNDILRKLIYLDQDYSFESVAIDQLITDVHIKVEKLNGDLLSDFALKSPNVQQTFREKNKFLGSVTGISGLIVNGLLDGIDLKNIDFLLKSQNQTFQGSMTIRKSEVSNLVAEIVNGVDLGYYISEGVSRSGQVRITGSKYFTTVQVTSLNLEGNISEVNLEELYGKSIVTTGKPQQTFQGQETQFEFLETKTMVVGMENLNDKWNVSDFVSVTSGRYELDSLEFLVDVNTNQLTVNRALNRIRVSEGELDLILKVSSKIQTIGNKVFEEIVLQKDSESRGLVDGVNLTNWSSEKKIQLSQNQIRIGTFAPNGYIRIDEGINIEKYGKFIFLGEDVMRLLQNSLLLNATELPYTFRGSISFESLQVVGNSEVRSVNRISPWDWLTQSPDNSNIVFVKGQKKFIGDVTLLSSFSASGLYYSLSFGQGQEILGQLQDLLVDGKDQIIQRNTVFDTLLSVDRLNSSGLSLNGIPFQHLLLVNADQQVDGKVKFSTILRITNSFVVTGNIETSLLNGYNLTQILWETLKIRSLSPQVFEGIVTFNGGLIVENLVSEGGIGGFNMSILLGHIIRKDSSGQKVIEGSLIFSQGAIIHNQLDFTGELNGIGHADWGIGLLLTSPQHQVVHTPIRFQKLSTINVTTTNGRVSNYNIVRFANEIIRVDEGGSLGVATFNGNIVTLQNIQATRVNGLRIPEDLLLISGKNEQVVTGTKTFNSGWEIDESLTVQLITGVDYNQAANFAFGNTALRDNLRVEGNLILKREPFFRYNFNGEEWTKIIEKIWWTDEGITIQAQHEFDKLTLEEGGFMKGRMDGIDIILLEKSYLSLSKDQVITGQFSYGSSLTFNDLKVDELFLEEGLINGVDLEEFRNSVILDGNQQIINIPLSFYELTVENLVLEDGKLIGDLDLNTQLMTLHGENIFKIDVTMEALNVDELILGNETLLNGINLAEWFKNSIKEVENSEVEGSVEFLKAQFSQNIQVFGLVDGINFNSENILSLSGDQELSGLITFKGGVKVKAINVTGGFVNGFNLQKIIESIILIDEGTGPLTIFGEKTFTQLLKAESLVTEALFQGHNVSDSLENLRPETYLSYHFNESLEQRYTDMGQFAFDLSRVADHRGVFLEYFDVTSRLDYGANFTSITKLLVIKYGGNQKLFMSSERKDLWNRLTWGTLSEFNFSNYIEFKGVIRGFVGIERQGEVYLIVSVSNHGSEPVQTVLQSQLTKTGFQEFEVGSGKYSRTFVLKLTENGGEWVLHQILHGYNFGDVASLTLSVGYGATQQCAVVIILDLSSARAVILCFDPTKILSRKEDDAALEIFQTIPLQNSSSIVKTLTLGENTFLVIGNGDVVDVWTHGPGDGEFLKESCIPVVNLQSMDLSLGIGYQMFLALGSEEVKGSLHYGRVYIYRYSSKLSKFEKFQSIAVNQPMAVEFQNLIFITIQELLYIQSDKNLYVYCNRGLSGFALEHIIPTPYPIAFETTSFVSDEVFKAQALLATNSEIQIFSAEFNGLLEYKEAQSTTTKTS